MAINICKLLINGGYFLPPLSMRQSLFKQYISEIEDHDYKNTTITPDIFTELLQKIADKSNAKRELLKKYICLAKVIYAHIMQFNGDDKNKFHNIIKDIRKNYNGSNDNAADIAKLAEGAIKNITLVNEIFGIDLQKYTQSYEFNERLIPHLYKIKFYLTSILEKHPSLQDKIAPMLHGIELLISAVGSAKYLEAYKSSTQQP